MDAFAALVRGIPSRGRKVARAEPAFAQVGAEGDLRPPAGAPGRAPPSQGPSRWGPVEQQTRSDENWAFSVGNTPKNARKMVKMYVIVSRL